MKRILALVCMMTFLMTACGGDIDDSNEPTAAPAAGTAYREESFSALPNDYEMYEEEMLNVTELQTNMQGEPAMYQVVTDTDENDEDYSAICEYTLNSEGNWQTKTYVRKALTRLLKKAMEETVLDDIDIPYVTRGDDGNLYGLLKIVEASEQPVPMGRDEELPTRYSVLVIDESTNAIQEVKLQTKVEADGAEIDYAVEYDVSAFHVMEDGTYFLVFNGASAMWFDAATGVQTNFCESIADSAFGKKVGYGESEIVYYSMAKKKFCVLDAQSMTLTSSFGDDISEEDRNHEWYFDTDAANWQMYAFNQSGLYRFSDFGQKTSATRLSTQGNFDHLADTNIYDVLVGPNEELYLLVRQASEEDASWDFGVLKYECES